MPEEVIAGEIARRFSNTLAWERIGILLVD